MDDKEVVCLMLGNKHKDPLQRDRDAHHQVEAREARRQLLAPFSVMK